ncbi:MAG: response regulator transcription factor [Acholeplasmataceae bacterium]|nr:response regulator transcription factor [Acholeplasmataceae bacterium]
MKILVIEDHKKINDLIALYSRQDHHEVFQAFSAEEAISIASNQAFDVLITDLMLPGLQGEELIKQMRLISDVYIIVLSAKSEIKHKIDVISLGADDYLTKPFSVEELMAKLKNLEKRLKIHTPVIYSFNQGELKINREGRQIFYNDVEIEFTRNEYELLLYLSIHKNRVFSRDEIFNLLFKDSDAFDRVIDAYVKNIRKKLYDHPQHPKYIKTFYGTGYQFIGVSDDQL